MLKYLFLLPLFFLCDCKPITTTSTTTLPITTTTIIPNTTITTTFIDTPISFITEIITTSPHPDLVSNNSVEISDNGESFLQSLDFQIVLDLVPTFTLLLISSFSFLIFKTQLSFVFYKYKIKSFTLGNALFLLLLIPPIVVYSIYTQDDMASLTGKLALFFFSLTLVSVTKTNIWTFMFNLPPERANKFHLFFAFLTVAFSIGHTAITLYDHQRWHLLIETISDTGGSPVSGTVMLLALLLTGVISFFRRNHWNFFLYSHRLLILIAYISLFIHFQGQLYYLLILPTLIILGDLILSIYNKSKSSTIVEFEIDKNTTLIKVEPYRKLYTKFGPGSYFYITMPTISPIAHPFSIISGPNDNILSFMVKKMEYGSWTHKLFYTLEEAYIKEYDQENSLLFLNENVRSLKCNIPAYLSGPFGSLTINLKATSLLLLFCNGIGITPVLSTVKFFLQDKNKNALLVWIGRSNNHVIKQEINRLEFNNVELQLYDNMKPNISSIYSKVLTKNSSFKGKIATFVCGSSSLTDEVEQVSAKYHIPCHKETFLL